MAHNPAAGPADETLPTGDVGRFPTGDVGRSPTGDAGRSPTGDAGRDRLLAAAVAAFGEKGFHATTTRDIARAANLSPAAVYVHHPSKEDLLYLISIAGHLELRAALEVAVAAADDPAGQLAALVRAFVTEHAARRDVARVVNDELDALSPEHRGEVDEHRRAMEKLVRDIIAAGVQRGDFVVADAHLTARAVLSLGMDVAHWFRSPGRWSVATVAQEYAELALRMVGAVR
ncbi:MAG: TetR/AcrR family transcriptional regulator [Austwickia sp.]|nr:TetR/AcrR family transcriptional regulator [Actinomycetota bacterium]MCO5310690.1 TetR/AcrR family transcriptional regulator [Austwickia sp.]